MDAPPSISSSRSQNSPKQPQPLNTVPSPGVTSNLEAMRTAVEPMSCSLSFMLTTSTR